MQMEGNVLSPDSQAPSIVAATQNLLIDTVSTPFDFDVLWGEVAMVCRKLLNWDKAPSVITTKQVAQDVTKAYVMVYHLVSHPCINTPRVNFERSVMTEGRQALAVYVKFRDLVHQYLDENVAPKFQHFSAPDYNVIQTYVLLWRSFLVAVTNLKAVFSSLAPSWNALGFEENPFERIEDIASSCWSEVVLTTHVQQLLQVSWAASICAVRTKGIPADQEGYFIELKDILAMLPNQSYYETILARTYMADLSKYAREEAAQLRSQGVKAYSTAALRCIEDESERAGKYLKSNRQAIDMLVNIFVDQNIDFFQAASFDDWMGNLEDSASYGQAYSVYNLLSRSRRIGLPLLQEGFTNAVSELAMKKIQEVVAAGGKDGYGNTIRCFLSVIKKLGDVVTEAFHKDTYMLEAMESGLRHALLYGGRGVIDPMLLAERLAVLSCSTFRAPVCRQPDAMSIEDIVCIYCFLPDDESSAKDAFLSSYQKQLARRLLSGEYTVSLEKHALYLLVQVKQSPVLFECRTMLRAVTVGSIEGPRVSSNGTDCTAVVLSSSSWPAAAEAQARVPAPLTDAVAQLAEQASRNLPGRQVTLAPRLSYGVLRMNLPPGSPRPCVLLRVNLLQIAMVEALSSQTAGMPFGQLCERMGASLYDCTAAVVPFVAVKLATCTHIPPTPTSEVRLTPCPVLPADGEEHVNLIPDVTQVDLLPPPGCPKSCGTEAAVRIDAAAVETRVAKLLKSDGAKSVDQIHEHVQQALHPHPVTKSDLKKALEKLLAREFIARDPATQEFRYTP